MPLTTQKILTSTSKKSTTTTKRTKRPKTTKPKKTTQTTTMMTTNIIEGSIETTEILSRETDDDKEVMVATKSSLQNILWISAGIVFLVFVVALLTACFIRSKKNKTFVCNTLPITVIQKRQFRGKSIEDVMPIRRNESSTYKRLNYKSGFDQIIDDSSLVSSSSSQRSNQSVSVEELPERYPSEYSTFSAAFGSNCSRRQR